MTFEEFTAKLPRGITGAIVRRGDGESWGIRLWEDPYLMTRDNGREPWFSIYLRSVKGESVTSLFLRALPVAEAYLEALGS